MNKYLLLLLPVLLCMLLIACDFTSEIDVSVGSGNESSIDSSTESSIASGSESKNESSATNSESAPTDVEKAFDVSVSAIGADALDASGLKLKNEISKTVTVTVKGEKNAIDALDASSIIATVDLSGITTNGNIECLINVTIPDEFTFVSVSETMLVVEISKKSTTVTPPVDADAYLSNGIIVSGNRGMEQFGGSATAGSKTAEKLNTFKAAVGANVNVYVLPCPTASAFYAPEKYASSITAHVNFYGGIRDNLVDVKYVDTLAALGAHTDEYLYYRTDFHWTGLAGYYAAEALAKVAGAPFDNLSTYTEQYTENCFKGSLVRYASVLGNDPDDVYWYVPSRQYTVTYYSASGLTNPKTGMTLFSSANGYTKFMHGDSYTAHIKSDITNGRKLLIFKNSYGNALAPYVLSSFEEVYIADIRKFQENAKEFITQYGITDVCFAMSSHALAGDARNYITKLLEY